MGHSRTEALPATVAAALRWATDLGLERLSAQWLLLHALGRPLDARAWLLAHDDAVLDDGVWTRYRALCLCHRDGEPLAYLTGERGFYGLTLRVDARVLDPRPDTETLVDWALELLQAIHAPTVLDMGTGSGAIALALAHQRPDASVWALDASTDALAVAAANGQRLGLPVHWIHGHWWDGWCPWTPTDPAIDQGTNAQRCGTSIANGDHTGACLDSPTTDGSSVLTPTHFDLIVSNPPYLRESDPHLTALRHEPRSALVAGPDGLRDLRTLVARAPQRLRADGWLLLEHGWDQADAVAALLRARGFVDVAHRCDLGGHRRCTGGRWPAAHAALPSGPPQPVPGTLAGGAR
ncbi:HemK/PrmC family methyltransferase [Tepidimonas sp.]|uniref:HemK/PrmC family methyltransferase n=1 Tax=Tepidimonas sp. TaxID=2002775 RepID=UPI002FE234DE